jgi:hypothetical protein
MIYSAGLGGEAFSTAQHSGSLGPARLMAKRMSLAGRKRLLDVGGGSGAYTLAFCAANPQLRATILDFPQTVETAKRFALDAGLTDRVAHLAGNAMTTEWPAARTLRLPAAAADRARNRCEASRVGTAPVRVLGFGRRPDFELPTPQSRQLLIQRRKRLKLLPRRSSFPAFGSRCSLAYP